MKRLEATKIEGSNDIIEQTEKTLKMLKEVTEEEMMKSPAYKEATERMLERERIKQKTRFKQEVGVFFLGFAAGALVMLVITLIGR